MTQSKIDLKKLRELCGIYIESVEKDDCRWTDYQAEYDQRTMPMDLLQLLDALDETRAALAKTECQCREDFPGYADYECRRCRVLAKLEEKFE